MDQNQLNKETSSRLPPDILRNIPGSEDQSDWKCQDKLLNVDPIEKPNEKSMAPEGGWNTKHLGQLVEPYDTCAKKRIQRRKLKKGLGWTFWVVCPPVALLFNCLREQPIDPKDPWDWNDDPLRPWYYKVDLEARPT